MGISFTKKGSAAAKQMETPQEEANNDNGSAPQTETKKSSGSVISFMKKGAAAKAAVAKEDAKAEQRRLEYNKLYRFSIPYDEDAQITFLDGKLDDDGVLDIPRYYEHRIQVGADWKNFVCTGEIDQSQPCPICESGDKSSLVGVMTVIDHRTYEIKKGPNAGKTRKNERKLFVAKEGTLKQLNKLASKPDRHGLAGCTFDVSRSGENKHPPAVGDTFDFVVKHKTLQSIADKYDLKIEEVQPAQYDGDGGEITYIAPEKLVELGIGKKHGGVGYEKGVKGAADEL